MSSDLEIKYLHYSRLDSTQSEAWRRCAAFPDSGWTAIAADWQESGRGQRGDAWQNGRESNVQFSVLSPPLNGAMDGLPAVQAAVALAVLEGLKEAGAPGQEIDSPVLGPTVPQAGLKWPNDLVLDGRKWGGILVEGSVQHNRLERLVLGVGVNLYLPEKDVPHAAAWSEWSRPPAAADLIGPLAERVVAAVAAWNRREPLAAWDALFPKYTAALWGLGHRQMLQERAEPHRRVEALLLGPTEDGRFRVEWDGEERIIHQGAWSWDYPLSAPRARP